MGIKGQMETVFPIGSKRVILRCLRCKKNTVKHRTFSFLKSVKNLTIEQPCNTVWLGKYKHIKRCAWNNRRVIWNSASCHEIQYGYTRAQHDKHMMSCPSNWVIWMTILCYYFCLWKSRCAHTLLKLLVGCCLGTEAIKIYWFLIFIFNQL